MAKIKNNKKNFLVIQMTQQEAVLIWGRFGGCGICDLCNKVPEYGFFVAVLNEYLCPDCFNDWIKRAKNYKEDKHFEKLNFDDTVHRLKSNNYWEE